MLKIPGRVFSSLLICSLAIAQLLFTNTAFAQSQQSSRFFGDDRYKTAAAISQNGWYSSDYVLLARGDNFADALCAGPLSKKYDAPILLTETNMLNINTLKEIKRLGAGHVIIVGGVGAVSENVEDSLKAAGITDVERIYGIDRFETSVKIAERLGNSSSVVLANGYYFPDDLSVSAIAAGMGMPILLTESRKLPDRIKQYIKSGQIDHTYVVGSTEAVSYDVEKSLSNPVRLGGKDRYEANVKVLSRFENQLDFSHIYVVTAGEEDENGFTDALTGAALAAKTLSPVILVNKMLPIVTGGYLKSKLTAGTKITVLGGEGAVPQTVADEFLNIISSIKPEASNVSSITDGRSIKGLQLLNLSWDDPSGSRAAGESSDIVFDCDLGEGVTSVDDVLYVMEWEKDGKPVSQSDIKILYENKITAGDKGLFEIGSNHNIAGHESVKLTVIFNSSGNYQLNIYAVHEKPKVN